MIGKHIIAKAKEDKRRTAIIAGAAVLVLLLVVMLGGGGKQRVLARSLQNLMKAKSYHTQAMLDLALPPRVNQNKQQPLVSVTMEVDGDVLEQNGQPVFTGNLRNEARGRGMVLFADGELRLLPQAVAFRLDNLPVLLNPKGNLTDKWTYVDVPTLETKNADQVVSAMESVVKRAKYVGKDNGLYHYRVALSSEDEQALTDVFRQGNSGNRSLNILARLMRAYEVGSLELWVDPQGSNLLKVATSFVKPQEGGSADEKATLTLNFSDYGKHVTVEEPPKELTVKPEVFRKMFGSGEIDGL